MGDVFPELKQREVHIREIIAEEEASFGKTLLKVCVRICIQLLLSFFTLCLMFWSEILKFVDFTELFLWVHSLALLEILKILKMGNFNIFLSG